MTNNYIKIMSCDKEWRYWNPTAIHCYQIGGNCAKCQQVPKDIKKDCVMKFSVIKLIAKLGAPTQEEISKNLKKLEAENFE